MENKYSEIFEMCRWRKDREIMRTDDLSNEDVLKRVGEEISILIIIRRSISYIGQYG